jgi:hypothetical protein
MRKLNLSKTLKYVAREKKTNQNAKKGLIIQELIKQGFKQDLLLRNCNNLISYGLRVDFEPKY